MFKNIDNTTDNCISTATELPIGTCGGCGTTEKVTDQCCEECSTYLLDVLTPSEQDALDALEYANNWIW